MIISNQLLGHYCILLVYISNVSYHFLIIWKDLRARRRRKIIMTGNIIVIFFVVAHWVFIGTIIQFFKIRSPIIMDMLDIWVSSPKIMHHIDSEIVTLMNSTKVLNSFMNGNYTLNHIEKIFVKDFNFNFRSQNYLFKWISSRLIQCIRRSAPVHKNLIECWLYFIKSI